MSIHEWINEYGIYHKNKTNKLIHWFCVPAIMFSLFGLLDLLQFNKTLDLSFLNLNIIANISILNIFILLSIIFYIRLSLTLSLGMIIFSILLVSLIDYFDKFQIIINYKLFIYLSIFPAAWIGQFIGHKIEGKKPAFFKDLQFLLIGPIWLLSFIYKKCGVRI